MSIETDEMNLFSHFSNLFGETHLLKINTI